MSSCHGAQRAQPPGCPEYGSSESDRVFGVELVTNSDPAGVVLISRQPDVMSQSVCLNPGSRRSVLCVNWKPLGAARCRGVRPGGVGDVRSVPARLVLGWGRRAALADQRLVSPAQKMCS